MDFSKIYNSGELIVPDGYCYDFLIVIIFKQCYGITTNAIGIVNKKISNEYVINGISCVDPKANRIIICKDLDESVSLGQVIRNNNDDFYSVKLYNELYGKIFDFVFLTEISLEQKNILSEFLNLRDKIITDKEKELARKISPEFFAWVNNVFEVR